MACIAASEQKGLTEQKANENFVDSSH